MLFYQWACMHWAFVFVLLFNTTTHFLNGGGQNWLTETVFSTASDQRLWLIMTLTETVEKTASINQEKKSKKKEKPNPTLTEPGLAALTRHHCTGSAMALLGAIGPMLPWLGVAGSTPRRLGDTGSTPPPAGASGSTLPKAGATGSSLPWPGAPGWTLPPPRH